MPSHSKRPPLWLMGLSNMSFGLMNGFVVLPLTQMLAAEGVPEQRIAAITAAAFSPSFWVFLLGPMLDVRFSRRWYATVFALFSGSALAGAVLLKGHLLALELLLMLGVAAVALSSNALGGWLATISTPDEQAELSAWNQVASFIGGGLMAVTAGELLAWHTSAALRAAVLGGLVPLPALIFLWMPAPGPDRRLARESFGEFFGEVLQLLRRREVLLVLLLFMLPTGSFALTNQLGGLGGLFHASAGFVSRAGGIGLVVVGSAACLLLPLLLRRLRPLPTYLSIGVTGALFTLTLLWAPRTPFWFAVAFLGENAFQAISFTAGVAITFEVIGQANPLAATQFGLLTSATVLPILYMGVLDGRVFSRGHLHGMLAFDGLLSLLACGLAAAVLRPKFFLEPKSHVM